MTFNRPLDGVVLPSSLRSLTFGGWFNQPIAGVKLPESLRCLIFGREFNQPLEGIQWPQGLRSLILSADWTGDWNQSVERLQLPDSLTELNLGGCTKPLNWPRPPQGVKWLTLSDWWNHPSSQLRLPPALTAFTLPSNFNQPLDDFELPATLRSLTLNDGLRQQLSTAHLPAGLTGLDLGGCSAALDGCVLPPSLTELRAGSRWAAAGLLPQSLRSLMLKRDSPGDEWLLPLAQVDLPPRLQHLTLTGVGAKPLAALRLPARLTALDIDMCSGALDGVVWPPALTELRADSRFAAAGLLPESLRTLTLHPDSYPDFRGEWLLPLAEMDLPARLQRLTLIDAGSQSLAALRLPPSLTALALEGNFTAPLADWNPPASLREFWLSNNWNLPISQLRLPPRLEVLAFGYSFDQPVDDLVLPPTLTELHLGHGEFRFRRLISGLLRPGGLRVLSRPKPPRQ